MQNTSFEDREFKEKILASKFKLPTLIIRTEIIENNRIRVKISDNGVGMSESVRSRVFDPFFTTKEPGQGTGLGASICYQIVVGRHAGQLQWISQLGVGTDAVIEIPIQQSNYSNIRGMENEE